MKKPRVQQRTERRISAALRLVLVAVLLVLVFRYNKKGGKHS